MDIILTNHSKQRMIERNITLNQIKETIDFPDYTLNKDNIIEVYKKIEGKMLKVVYIKKGKFKKIITLIWK